ncbi:unnamed protein product [Schistosoma curassoni]|nr:unnamed protein product [Schistosoma curassoni]
MKLSGSNIASATDIRHSSRVNYSPGTGEYIGLTKQWVNHVPLHKSRNINSGTGLIQIYDEVPQKGEPNYGNYLPSKAVQGKNIVHTNTHQNVHGKFKSTSHEQVNSQLPIKTKHSHTKNHRNIKNNENNYQWVINPIHKKSQHELDQIPIINNNNISYHDYSLNRLNIEKHKSRSKSKVLEKSETLDMETSKDIFTRSVSAHPILMNTPQLPPKIYKSVRTKYYQPDAYQTITNQSKLSLVNSREHTSPLYSSNNPIISNKISSQMEVNQIDHISSISNSHSYGKDISLINDTNRNNSDQTISHYCARRKHCRVRKHKALDGNDKRNFDVKSMKSSTSDKTHSNKLRNDTTSNTSSGFSSHNLNSIGVNSTDNLNSVYDISINQTINSHENINFEDKQSGYYNTARNLNEMKKLKINSQKFPTLSNQMDSIPQNINMSGTSSKIKYPISNVTIKKSPTDIQLSNPYTKERLNEHQSRSQYPIQIYFENNNTTNKNSVIHHIKHDRNENVDNLLNNDYGCVDILPGTNRKALRRSNSSSNALTFHPQQFTVNRVNNEHDDYCFTGTLLTKHSQIPPLAFKQGTNNNEIITKTNHNNIVINNDHNFSNDGGVDTKAFYSKLDIHRLRNNALSPTKQYPLNQSNFLVHPTINQQFIDPFQSKKMINTVINENTFCLLNAEEFRNELAKIVTPGDPRADLHEICRIGKGSTGVVYLMRHSPTKQYVAVKKMNIFKQQRRELLFNEVIIMQSYPHPNIVEMFGSYLIGNELWVAMEYLEGGALTNIVTRTLMSEKQIATICRDVLRALAFLHDHGIIHRDIKSDSILLSINGRVKLSDFGFCARISPDHPRRRSLVGTPYWMSPEVISRLPYSTSVDVWSMGVLLIEMVDGEPTFFNEPPLRAMRNIQRDAIPHLMYPHKKHEKKNYFSTQLFKFRTSHYCLFWTEHRYNYYGIRTFCDGDYQSIC